MNKYLEALERLTYFSDYDKSDDDHDLVFKALTEYEAIKNAEPTKALEYLEEIKSQSPVCYYDNGDKSYVFEKELETIKQALLKAQEQEKAIAQFKEIVSLDYLCRVFGYPLGKQIKEYFMSNELLKQTIERVEEEWTKD